LEGKSMQDPQDPKEARRLSDGAVASSEVAGSQQTPQTANQLVSAQGQTLPPPTQAIQPRRSRAGLRAGALVLLALVLLLVLGIGLFAGWQFSRNSSPGAATTTSSASTQAEAVAAKFKQSVVQINVVTEKGEGLGSGTIIDSRGYIVTNNHVVEGAKQIQVLLYDGMQLPAQLTGTDAADDLAVVKITPAAQMAVARIGDSSQLKVAQDVMALGNPLGITQTVTSGIVSALGRNVPEAPGVAIVNAIQTDTAINPGNSGGALIDLEGQLIGIPTLTIINPTFDAPASGIGFAIPSNTVKFIVPQLIETGKVTNSGRASLGVKVATVDSEVAAQQNLAVDHGALIVSVTADGPAASAGLKPGDVIVEFGNTAVTNVQSLQDALLSARPGETVAVTVFRGKQQMRVNVKLGERPPADGQVSQ
jgi:S1-C subfamily serine protease